MSFVVPAHFDLCFFGSHDLIFWVYSYSLKDGHSTVLWTFQVSGKIIKTKSWNKLRFMWTVIRTRWSPSQFLRSIQFRDDIRHSVSSLLTLLDILDTINCDIYDCQSVISLQLTSSVTSETSKRNRSNLNLNLIRCPERRLGWSTIAL